MRALVPRNTNAWAVFVCQCLVIMISSCLVTSTEVLAQPPTPKSAINAGNDRLGDTLKLGENELPLKIVYSPDGKFIAAAGLYGIDIWNRVTGDHRHIALMTSADHFPGQMDFRFQLSPSSLYVVLAVGDSASSDNHIQGGVWSTADGKKVLTYDLPAAPYGQQTLFAFSPKNKYFASLAADNIIVVTELATGKTIARLKGHTGAIGALTFSADETQLFSGASDPSDGTVRIWSIASPDESQIFAKERSTNALVATPDGKSLLMISRNSEQLQFAHDEHFMGGEVTQWDLHKDGSASLALALPEPATSIEVAPDGKTAYLRQLGAIVQWDTQKLAPVQPKLQLKTNSPPDGWVSDCLSQDKKVLAVINRQSITLWDVVSRQRSMQFDHPSGAGNPSIGAISPDGSELAIYYDRGETRRLKPTGLLTKPIASLTLKSGVRELRFVQNDDLLAISLVPNGTKSHEGAFSQAVQKEAEQYALVDQALDAKQRKFMAARGRERTTLMRRLQKEESMSADQLQKDPPEELQKFEAETLQLIEQQFGLPRRKPIADIHNRLWDAHDKCGLGMLGELAALWKPGAAGPELVVSQPRFVPEEFSYNPNQPWKIEGYAIEDSTQPVRGHIDGRDSAPLLQIHDDRLIWWDRLKNNMQLSLGMREVTSLGEPNLDVRAWLLSPDGKLLYVEGRRNNVDGGKGARKEKDVFAILHLESKKWVPLPEGRIDIETYLKAGFTPDSRRLLVHMPPPKRDRGSRKKWIFQIDVETGLEVGTPISFPEDESIRTFTVSPDGKWLALIWGRERDHLHLIDLATGKERETFAPERVKLPIFSPDSLTLAIVVTSGRGGKSVQRANPNTKFFVNVIPEQEEDAPHQVLLIDIATGKARASVQGWSSFVHAMHFSPDSKILAVGGGSLEHSSHSYARSMQHNSGFDHGELRLHSAETGATIAPLVAHEDLVTCLAFDQSGARLASGSLDRTVKIWEIAPFSKSQSQPLRQSVP